MKKLILTFMLILVILLSACTASTFPNKVGEVDGNGVLVCTEEYSPVCGTADIRCITTPCPQQMTYGNECLAKAADAEILYVGPCNVTEEPDLLACTREYRPVCGVDKNTYSNECLAGDVEIAYEGQCRIDGPEPGEGYNEHNCGVLEGIWIDDFNECEGLSQENCEKIDGMFLECASACRHETNPLRPCTMQCVQVCVFDSD